MDEDTRQRLEILERRINEAHAKADKFQGILDDLKRGITRWQSRLMRLYHYLHLAINDEETPTPPTKAPPRAKSASK